MTPLIIVNPASGRGKTLKMLPELEAELERRSFDAEVRVSSAPADPIEWCDEAAAQGRTVVAFGGDGLVNSIIDTVAGRTTIGVIPGGVGNDHARSIGIPTDVGAALDAIQAHKTRKIDLGRVTAAGKSRLYSCIASAGFDSLANEVANGITWMSGAPLYTLSALVTLVRWSGAIFTVEIDGETEDIPAWLVAVGNGSSYGGGMQMCPSADLDDGLLDVTILEEMSKLTFITTFPKVFKGAHVNHPSVRTFKVEKLTVSADREFVCYADGEAFAPLPVTFEVVPGGAEIIVP